MTGKVFNDRNHEARDNSLIHFSKPKKSKKFGEKSIKLSKAYYIEDDNKLTLNYELLLPKKYIIKSQNDNNFIIVPLDIYSEFDQFVTDMNELGVSNFVEKFKLWFPNINKTPDRKDIYKLEKRDYIDNNNCLFLKINESLSIKNQFGEPINLDDITEEDELEVLIRFDGLLIYTHNFSSCFYIKELTVNQKDDNDLKFITDSEDDFNESDEDFDFECINNKEEKINPEEVSVLQQDEMEHESSIEDSGSDEHEELKEFIENKEKNVEDSKTNDTTQEDDKTIVPSKNIILPSENKIIKNNDPEPTDTLGPSETDSPSERERKYRELFNRTMMRKSEKSYDSFKS